jgi:uncharacterized membrane protein YdfJ with MMPL/SSD domain
MKRFFAMAVLLMVSASTLAANLYRYENDQGVMVINDTVPPEFVHKGYDIISPKGRLIERVPRALTPEELAAKSAEDRAALDRAKQAEADKKLLTIFSSAADAERARDRKIEAIDVNINVTRGNILKLQGDFNTAQAQAAERERAGQKVPEYLVENMDSLRRQIESAEASIIEREMEKEVIRKEYQNDIERLRYLLEQRGQASGQ